MRSPALTLAKRHTGNILLHVNSGVTKKEASSKVALASMLKVQPMTLLGYSMACV